MQGTSFEVEGVHIYSMTNYYFIVKTEELEMATSAVNGEVVAAVADKVDPAVLDAVTNATDILSSVSMS